MMARYSFVRCRQSHCIVMNYHMTTCRTDFLSCSVQNLRYTILPNSQSFRQTNNYAALALPARLVEERFSTLPRKHLPRYSRILAATTVPAMAVEKTTVAAMPFLDCS
jgi:hypothetical protein